ncbi:5-oxoprolinase/urea amidolyase family protein [Leptobacterium flavescens]|uniref:5-oxoprolinase/urea amidolyase family protein n=1 Tax=Leptobacterium flavescens TaxID=472055 RepID=A0A6P0UST8_9FLAO|nr:biotin-dependent carboxyltransferase family protein [Leptobacterium flavescens]NER13923.1 5-oxoprolinase/urea amidolyase family protein [Leptobacterium flavescens]
MIEVIKPGFYSSVQDMGRFGYRQFGVPVSGAMDMTALNAANFLLGNDEKDAALEITMTGPLLRFHSDTFIVITGACMEAKLNDTDLENNVVYRVRTKDELRFGRLRKGFRSYLGIKGGIQIEKVLESRSFYKNISPNAMIATGDKLPIKTLDDAEPEKKVIWSDDYLDKTEIEVYPGPEYHQLNDKQLEKLFSREFTIAKENNRMAYQLEEQIQEHPFSLLTSAALPGTVQLTSSGKLIILMRDGQTTGGYPRILQLSEKGISTLAQKKTFDKIELKLKLIS